ncbi:ATP-binding protein [Desulfococcaceae bacterium HSG9]|nr:ATP-binding protein [Desulfococcaceae bacterium HSG9]
MTKNRFKPIKSSVSPEDRRRRKREIIIIVIIIAVVPVLTYFENRVIDLGVDFPISNAILMFTLININLLLLLLLIFLVFRNLVKLFYDRRRKVMGSKLRTKLVATFITLTLLPTAILFLFSIHFITASIKFWFNAPVEQALTNSIAVGRSYYERIEEHNLFYLKRIAYQIVKKNLSDPKKVNALEKYIRGVQRTFNIQGIEVYSPNYNRIAFSVAESLETIRLNPVTANDFQKEFNVSGVHTISENTPNGELFRIIGTVPNGIKPSLAQAFAVITILIPSSLSDNMASISKGVEEYQQIKLLKKPIQSIFYITLTIVALLVLFCAIWFGFYLAKSISIPIMELAEGTRRIAEGDLSFFINRKANDEIGILVDSFNKMTNDLRMGREQLMYSARILREQNTEIEEKRQYMEIVLENVSAGVITIGPNGLITTINKSAQKMLDLDSEDVINKSYKNILKGDRLDLAMEIMENLTRAREDAIAIPLKLSIAGRSRSFVMHFNALKDDDNRHIGIVMVFDDLTELEKAQRMAAWREVARRIAHEVKNPLTPIKLSAQRLQRRYNQKINESVFEECTKMIIDHVDLIRNLVNEFSSFAKFPTAKPLLCELPPIVTETLALYKEGHPEIDFKFDIHDEIPSLNLDRQQIKQAMINLVDNAIVSIKQEGTVHITLTHDPILNMVRIEVADNGKGISDENKTRLFEPYFSTKSTGMGLGLTIVSSIIADHNGLIRVRDNKPHGAKFVIELPV